MYGVDESLALGIQDAQHVCARDPDGRQDTCQV